MNGGSEQIEVQPPGPTGTTPWSGAARSHLAWSTVSIQRDLAGPRRACQDQP